MTEEAADSTLKKLVQHVTKAFFIATPEDLLTPLERLAASESDRNQLASSAVEGLKSVIGAASLPFQLTCDAVQNRRFYSFLAAERIRGLKEVSPGQPLSDEQQQRAHLRAQKKMKTFVESEAGSTEIQKGILNDLSKHMDYPPVSMGAYELLVQCLISTWGVFETFAASFIIDWLNANPRAAKSAVASRELKEYFGKPVLEIDVIDSHGFDLTRSMGSALFRGKKLDNLTVVKAVLGQLFSNAELQAALNKLWLLNQRRHLFVHRRGIVDEKYLENAKTGIALGQRLIIESDDVETHIIDVHNAIVCTIETANNFSKLHFS